MANVQGYLLQILKVKWELSSTICYMWMLLQMCKMDLDDTPNAFAQICTLLFCTCGFMNLVLVSRIRLFVLAICFGFSKTWLVDLSGSDPDSGFSFETNSPKMKLVLRIRISETALTNKFLFSFRFETKPKWNQNQTKWNWNRIWFQIPWLMEHI